MNLPEDKPCPDCKSGTMKAIRIIDQQLAQHHHMQYTVPEAKRSFWSSKYPVEGEVLAIMCDDCGFIKLYGNPSSQ